MWPKNKKAIFFIRLAAGLLFVTASCATSAQTWQFSSLEERLPENANFTSKYVERVFSVSTVVSDAGNQFGTYVMPDGSINSYNIKFGTNPPYTLFDNPDFVHLAAGEAGCFWFVCVNEIPFGIRVTDTTAVTGWLTTLPESSPLPGSLPVYRFPGSFVEENAQDIVATTLRSADEQFSAVLDDNLDIFIKLTEIPWVVALSSGQEPLVLGFRGAGGDCVVYGESCIPDDCLEEDGDSHDNTRGVGHREHGRGYGYGHHKHDCHEGQAESGDFGEPVLVQTRTDNSWQAWTFPTALAGHPEATLTQRFPLTMNDHTVILRASISLDGQDYPNRMLRCDLSAAIDLNGDDVVDCTDGLRPLIPLADSDPVDTVIGFTLNNSGQLTGNHGFNAAGIGHPFLLDLTEPTPSATPLHNLAAGSSGWELNNVSDINIGGMAVGYGHRNCSEQPQSWLLEPDTAAPPALTLAHAVQPLNAATAPGESFTPVVPVSGGSGLYEYRISSMLPGDADWQTEQDWRGTVGAVDTPPDYLGDLCLRVQVRDAGDNSLGAEKVIRVRVTNETLDAPSPRTPDLLGDREVSEPLEEFTQLGTFNLLSLCCLLMTGFFRRR